MRHRLTDLLILLAAAAAGFYISGVIFYLCAYLGWLPVFPAGSGDARLFLAKFQLAQLFWLGGIVLGIAALFLRRADTPWRELRFWLVAMPALLPLLYTALVFVYFNFLPHQLPPKG